MELSEVVLVSLVSTVIVVVAYVVRTRYRHR